MLWGNLVSTGGDVQAQAGGALPNARTRRRAAPNKFSEFRDAVRMGIHTHTHGGWIAFEGERGRDVVRAAKKAG
jgi:hypothetical protein